MRVVIHSIFVLGPSALGMEKVASDNCNLRIYVTTKYLSCDCIIKIGICTSNYPVEPLKATLCDHFGISVYFVYFIIYINVNNSKLTFDKF